ncbi:MAG: flavin reductase family protein [Nocardioidaceae bacterium]
MSCFPTGVAVVTGMREGVPVGMAANSFTSVSLDPLLVLFCAAHTSSTWPQIKETQAFAVNILPEQAVELARRFAEKDADRFAGVNYRRGVTDSPIMVDAAAFLECRIERIHEAGDHVIVVGSVLDLGEQSADEPLVFHRSEYRELRRVPEELSYRSNHWG